MKIVLATCNAGKIAELRRILTGFDIVGLEEFPAIGEIAETGVTFEENALIKAHAVAQGSGLPAVADDSGLCVDVLNGMPGVFSARWAGRHGDDRANLELLLAQVSDVPSDKLTAYFACAAALALPSGESRVVEGTLPGGLVRTPRGSGGFGYDPIFVPEGESRTTAELTPEEKDAISHRGRAFRALAPIVRDLLAS
ncbi:Nucleoside 5-triphosphatase RdgB (dHAPTP, dITP, XTP-specific) [[Actinomadura] parvosata subsp. kistnae]|uniref:dITP/XTP pyrophosphatase n=1 Tax=[Actinomadura] parvosata subsp. kistnae TaxID=1909395 RepID=A0A1V0A7G6_9ACTN|nr:RdgB/HAM1 family non-canonical purine NTP pyrophosphatase [Nonomuraea sp. ATCC 55076]AQZ66157.1 non-canonical purine NTP pyrophosphatase, RdgB/HAM1 family [Nonomuraea sp. ATCC 55076]SPL97661.1 Nucleoside 5-triphosphatase RdgB (dHAPTP, dITP, XTP-specific) [Actinomadura parvosata subsp. kistnae]